MALAEVSLDDKYTRESGRIYLTGIQALVRLPMLQRARDIAAGHDTAGYISGYRGSPLGGLDQQLTAAKRFLEQHRVVFQPGVNEDLAATALWGTQQAGLHGEGRFAGVFGMWYGKGPGVDRTGDAFRHANLAGTAPLGGVLVCMGDDHTCESSTTAHQSEFALLDAMIPVVNPAGVAELLEFGLLGFALARYSGCWVGLKCVHDTVNSAASIELDPGRAAVRVPDDFELPPGGLNIRWPDTPLAQEERLHRFKLEAVRAFARANAFDRLVFDSPNARLGIVSTGKSYLDLRQALADLGIDRALAERLGLRVLKLGLVWPLEPERMLAFAHGLEQIIVVEEKRALIEAQLKELLYGRADAPVIIGKRDEHGAPLFPSHGALSSNQVALALADRILGLDPDDTVAAHLAELRRRHDAEQGLTSPILRTPYFCSGCPHNTSTRVPDGSIARAGIGCHYMAQWMDRANMGYTQMGGEGANWVGEAPFSTRAHVFQNLGDGTYFHSGSLGIRAAVAAGVNITFKILYNDAVAMTGGQQVDGPLTVPQISREVMAEGAKRVVVVTDDPDKYPLNAGFAPGVAIRHRDDLDEVQRELREFEGTTVLIYDQTCAAEKRRRRKRRTMPDPPRRVVINELVCEGCGDCGLASNCVSIVPVETEFGRKRQIDQSSCNKDYSCLKGFCPSFVTVEGGALRKPRPAAGHDDELGALPEPELPALNESYGIVVGGVGGTGVVTIGQLLGMAAHLEGKGAAVLEMTGLAQKGGAVMSHLRVAPRPENIQTVRIAPGGARLLLGCDLVVAGGKEALLTLAPGRGHAVVNAHEMMTGDFTRNADFSLPAEALKRAIVKVAGERATIVEGTRLATALLGDGIATNLFMVGVAYQKGLLPVSAAAIERAIELNRVAADMNQRAFRWGRRAAHDLAAVEARATPAAELPDHRRRSGSLDEMVERRVAFLTDYQDAAYAGRYRALVERAREVEAARVRGRTELSEAVARYYFKLLAYKDEYEVARLYASGDFLARLRRQFEGQPKLKIHLAPPLLAERDQHTGHLKKRAYGPWIFSAMKHLARLRRLRGTPLDPFGYSAERRLERRLIGEYESVIEQALAALGPENYDTAADLARLPEQIRGFGHVKERHLRAAKQRESELLAALRAPAARLSAAE
ncbi:MAG TPA: indolepyruvate ferredoxin oxidoreductase family protein [Geminicoccaceae bacterium]|nr:indolepyruvate ferredoxin oxidoreductase family protein [Geminicoccaceae bacterium]